MNIQKMKFLNGYMKDFVMTANMDVTLMMHLMIALSVNSIVHLYWKK